MGLPERIPKFTLSTALCLLCTLALPISQFGILANAKNESAKYEKTDSGLIVTSNTFDENIERVEIGYDVIAILDGSFSKLKNLSYINVDSRNRFYASYEGCLYTKDYTELLCMPQNTDEVIVLNSVESYSEHALDGLSQERKNNLDNLIATGFKENQNTKEPDDYVAIENSTNTRTADKKKNGDTDSKENTKVASEETSAVTNNNSSVSVGSSSSSNSSSEQNNTSYVNNSTTSTQSQNGFWFNGEEYYENGRSHYDCAILRDRTFEEIIEIASSVNSDPDFVKDILWTFGWSRVGE